ncbi:hypothetical protein L9F63_020339, partial [Diploptera punctata]
IAQPLGAEITSLIDMTTVTFKRSWFKEFPWLYHRQFVALKGRRIDLIYKKQTSLTTIKNLSHFSPLLIVLVISLLQDEDHVISVDIYFNIFCMSSLHKLHIGVVPMTIVKFVNLMHYIVYMIFYLSFSSTVLLFINT